MAQPKTKKITAKQLSKAIDDVCQAAIADAKAQVSIMKLSEISDAAKNAYAAKANTFPAGTPILHDVCLEAARKAADEAVAKLRAN